MTAVTRHSIAPTADEHSRHAQRFHCAALIRHFRMEHHRASSAIEADMHRNRPLRIDVTVCYCMDFHWLRRLSSSISLDALAFRAEDIIRAESISVENLWC